MLMFSSMYVFRLALHCICKMSIKRCIFKINDFLINSQSRAFASITRGNFVDLLENRNMIESIFPEADKQGLYDYLSSKDKRTVYCGFDPTADSLHIGSLLPIIGLLNARRSGHDTLVVLGGMTASVGDPTGKLKRRSTILSDEIFHNLLLMKKQIERLYENHDNFIFPTEPKKLKEAQLSPPKILNNLDWYKNMKLTEFLSGVAHYFKLAQLIRRDSVQMRQQAAQDGRGEGLNFQEFSYQLLQAYDWYHLLDKFNCTIQLGGSDQLGNIQTGYEYIRHATNRKDIWGITVPLLVDPLGRKFSKTPEGTEGAVWIDPLKTSPFLFYQHFLRVSDSHIKCYLNYFTFLFQNEIKDVMRSHKSKPEKRMAQKKLAENVTLLVHGNNGLKSAKTCSEALYEQSVDALLQLSRDELTGLFQGLPTAELHLAPDTQLIDVVMKLGLFKCSSVAKNVITMGGIHLNNVTITNPNTVILPEYHILPGAYCTLLKVGRKNFRLIQWL